MTLAAPHVATLCFKVIPGNRRMGAWLIASTVRFRRRIGARRTAARYPRVGMVPLSDVRIVTLVGTALSYDRKDQCREYPSL
jgi:hypothetical protein